MTADEPFSGELLQIDHVILLHYSAKVKFKKKMFECIQLKIVGSLYNFSKHQAGRQDSLLSNI